MERGPAGHTCRPVFPPPPGLGRILPASEVELPSHRLPRLRTNSPRNAAVSCAPPLSAKEVGHVQQVAQRIAAVHLIGPVLNASYQDCVLVHS